MTGPLGSDASAFQVIFNNLHNTFQVFTILDRIRDLTRYEPEELKNQIGMPFGTPIDMAENFGDDTSLVLYFCCRITYTYDADNMFNLAYDSPAHKALLEDMKALID